ncbi:MAG: hypothetical protein IPM97_17305 [Bdellovibrionaceae bacterium]|nr:hypothetical protein [Pseudobdellovibrionaceae bacterium]
MKRILLFQTLIILLGVTTLFYFGPRHSAESFFSGGLLIAINFIFLGFAWNLVFRKKLVALSVLIIVFKYAILGVIIYQLVKQTWLLPFWFAAGVASMMIASLIFATTAGFFKEE